MQNSIEERLKNDSVINIKTMEKKYTTCVQNLVCKYNDKFTCYLCKISVNTLIRILKHIQTDGHQERKSIEKVSDVMNDFQIDETKCIEIVLNSIIVIDVKYFYCFCCTSSFTTLKDIDNHIKESRHMNNNCQNIINSVEPINLIYKCQTCKCTLKTNAEFKYHKMFHLSPERNVISNIDIINFSLQEDNTKIIHCSICNKIILSEEDLDEHVKSVTHHNWIDLLLYTKVYAISDIAQYLINLDIVYNSTTEITFIKSFYCQVCELEVLNLDDPKILIKHKNSKNHRTKMSLFIENEKSELTFVNPNCCSVYICFICNIEFIQEELLYDHYNSIIHQFRAKVLYEFTSNKYISIPTTKNHSNSYLQCTLCNIQATGSRNMLEHIFGYKHGQNITKNVSSSNKIVKENENVNKYINEIVSPKLNVTPLHLLPNSKNKSQFYCYICKTNVLDFMLIQHLKSKYHIRLLKKSKNILSIENKLFLCQICQESFSTDLQLIEHFRDSKHQDYNQAKLQNKNKSADSTDKTIKSFEIIFTPKNINQSQHLVDLKKPNKVSLGSGELVLDSVNISEEFSLKEEIKLRRPKKMLNLTKIGEKYIELCIESSNKNIYNIDANSMYKLKLDITLSLPTDLEWRYCIPCNKEISSNLKIFNQHLYDEEHKQKMLEMVVNDKPYSTNLNEYLSDFKLACSYMRKSSEQNTVLCFACLMKIENLKTSILDHMKSKAHVDNCLPIDMSSEIIFQNLMKTWQNFWYFAENFVCDICSFRCGSEIQFVEHLIHDQHFERSNKTLNNGDILKPDMCVHCATYWCSKANLFASHCNNSLHNRMLECQDYVVPKLMNSMNHILNHCDDTISSLLHNSDKIDRNIEKGMLKLLETTIQKMYPVVRAYLFGSRLSRTNFDNSDLDVYLDCDNTYHKFSSTEKSRERLLDILKCLDQDKKIWSVEDMNLTTKMPTIKLQHKAKNFGCNIQCSSSLNVEKSILIRFFVEACPDCRKLILFLKKWLVHCELSGTQGITDYAISVLVIFYLQTENILPSLSCLIQQKNQSNIIAGWETGFLVDKITLPKQNHVLKNLLLRLFNFYADFNYITDVVCPFLGRPAQKLDFVNFDKLPKEMNIYKILYESGKADVFRFDSPMCVQDPLELSENLTADVNKMQLRMFRQYCLESRKILDRI